MKEHNQKQLSILIDSIDKTYGKGAFSKLGDKPNQDVETISTGSFGLDMCLGVGGFPIGRIVEIYGQESSGKTTLALHTIAEAQKQGSLCAMIDMEHAFDKVYAEAIGVDVDNLYISQPDYGEQALDIVEKSIRSNQFSVIVIDSVAALIPKAELEGEMGDSKMGLHARLMSQALRKITGAANKTDTLLIFINQTREKIGVMFGNPITTTGGNALKFYASVRIETRKSTLTKDGSDVIGNSIACKVVKNKVAAPFGQCSFDIMFGHGISRETEVVNLGVECEVINKSGSWFNYGETKLGQGLINVVNLLRDNPELCEEIEDKIKGKVF